MAQAAESTYALKHTKLYCHDPLVLGLRPLTVRVSSRDFSRERPRNLWPLVLRMLAGSKLAHYG